MCEHLLWGGVILAEGVSIKGIISKFVEFIKSIINKLFGIMSKVVSFFRGKRGGGGSSSSKSMSSNDLPSPNNNPVNAHESIIKPPDQKTKPKTKDELFEELFDKYPGNFPIHPHNLCIAIGQIHMFMTGNCYHAYESAWLVLTSLKHEIADGAGTDAAVEAKFGKGKVSSAERENINNFVEKYKDKYSWIYDDDEYLKHCFNVGPNAEKDEDMGIDIDVTHMTLHDLPNLAEIVYNHYRDKDIGKISSIKNLKDFKDLVSTTRSALTNVNNNWKRVEIDCKKNQDQLKKYMDEIRSIEKHIHDMNNDGGETIDNRIIKFINDALHRFQQSSSIMASIVASFPKLYNQIQKDLSIVNAYIDKINPIVSKIDRGEQVSI